MGIECGMHAHTQCPKRRRDGRPTCVQRSPGRCSAEKGVMRFRIKTESGMAPCTTYRKAGSNAAPARGYCTKLVPSNRERPAANVSTSDKVTGRHMDECNDWRASTMGVVERKRGPA